MFTWCLIQSIRCVSFKYKAYLWVLAIITMDLTNNDKNITRIITPPNYHLSWRCPFSLNFQMYFIIYFSSFWFSVIVSLFLFLTLFVFFSFVLNKSWQFYWFSLDFFKEITLGFIDSTTFISVIHFIILCCYLYSFFP